MLSPQPVKALRHDGQITIATGRSRKEVRWKNQTLLWSELLKKLSQTVRTSETVQEYKKSPKSERDRLKDIGGFVGGTLKEGRRKAESVAWRSIITLDADYAQPDFWSNFTMFFDYAAAVYSTHSHTPESPRVRLLIPLSRQVTPDEYQAVARMVAYDIGIDQFDDSTYEPSRLMYWPSTCSDGEYIFRYQDGPWLDPDEILHRYDDWTDTSYWPQSSRVHEDLRRRAKLAGDPLEKPGIVGAFCRTYDVEAAIEKFLPDVYEKCDKPNRYTYIPGSTAAGLIVYDDGKFVYSHHGTDPIGSKLCNAFDLVRIHMFGHLDEDVSIVDTPVNKLPSFLEMSDFAAKDEGVKLLLGKERLERATEDFGEDVKEEDLQWVTQLTTNKQGKIESTIDNCLKIILNDPNLKGRIAYNEFKQRIVLMKDTPWKKVRDPKNGDTWEDSDDSALRHYIEHNYDISSVSKIYDAVTVAAQRRRFHPIRDYLDSLEWDGEARLDTLFIDYLGAEDHPYTRAITRKAFTAAVARIYEPGCKFDYVVTLSGRQGVGKSTIISKMAKGWFTDSLTGMTGKEAYEAIQGYWIIELSELSAMKKMEIESVKSFISKQVDSYRAAYGRRVEDHPRQCIFFGTTNSTAFLRDDTGSRRFWCLQVDDRKRKKTPWKDLTEDVIDQIWAEAVVCYRSGEPLVLSAELEDYARSLQELFTEDDPRIGMVQEYLDRLLPENWDDMDLAERRAWLSNDFGASEGKIQRIRVCIAEIWQECFMRDQASLKRQDINELHSIMRRMPGWKENPKKKKCGSLYGTQRCYERVADS